ncbi:MAG: acyl transferase, partial [Aequorivita sp.]|nr:acyl transferase [Aequorivita sp.]
MLEKEIFNINTHEDFDRLALEVFRFQYENVPVYHQFCNLLNTNVSEVKTVEHIPFLPIQFFKSNEIISENLTEQIVFTSSGTTGSITSKHYVADLK